MNNEMIRIHDLSTGEVIDRVMTDEEQAEWVNAQAENEKIALELERKEELRKSRNEKLLALGLTEEELLA